MVALCRAAGLPSRTVTGFELLEANSAAPLEWVEVWVSDRWTPFDPIRGFRGELPSNVIPVCRGNPNIVTARNVNELEAEFSIRELPLGSGEISFGRGRLTDIFDLTRLPLEMHNVLSLILLMPFGALVTCIARNLVGIKTSGTFTPTLLAMSFVSGELAPRDRGSHRRRRSGLLHTQRVELFTAADAAPTEYCIDLHRMLHRSWHLGVSLLTFVASGRGRFLAARDFDHACGAVLCDNSGGWHISRHEGALGDNCVGACCYLVMHGMSWHAVC